MKKETFIAILMENDQAKITDFLLKKGKGPKPICPIIFFREDKKEEERKNGYL